MASTLIGRDEGVSYKVKRIGDSMLSREIFFYKCSILTVLSLLLLTASYSLSAQPIKLDSKNTVDNIPSAVAENIVSRLREARSDIVISNLRRSPLEGIYKVNLNGQLVFISEDGGFLISGEMYQVNPGYLVNLQEEERREQEIAFAPQRAKMLAAVDKNDLIIYSPDEVKGHIYVFTDIDCGYCRKLHAQLTEMLNKGIEVRYLAFPRAGVSSRSAEKLITTWCSGNPQSLMTRFKRGENVKLAVCDSHPVFDQYMLGQDLGVTGTPAIVLESGKLIPGAVSPERLAREMGI
ncbi:MAG: thiol:disulfide interchange protein DsbC [Granulosicoccus sp.]|jgi:thiol:disulfide interchange protein DsbC